MSYNSSSNGTSNSGSLGGSASPKLKPGKTTLPDFDTLREMAKNEPEELERLRVALCHRVIDDAPAHAKRRLEGLMFQINAKRDLAKTPLQACEDISSMMHESLQKMQAMLKDLRSMQSESIALSSKKHRAGNDSAQATETADILPFRAKR